MSFPTDKPWLIIGKGPSFENLPQNYGQKYYTIGLNHVFQKVRVDIGLFIDLDVIQHLTECYTDKLLCPAYPHINYKPTKYRIDFLKKVNPVLQSVEDKLYYFSHSKKPCDFPTIPVRYSSSEAAFGILAFMGVRDIRSIGIDGGLNYAETFQHLKPLTNGQLNFNQQFKAIDKIVEHYNIRYSIL